MTLELLKQVY